ncbi:MAG: hypothetical protein EBU54_13505 [Mycobacteriaceae bacterium]|nr:hypothetical protein [Mycobacteriaceae bacterium]
MENLGKGDHPVDSWLQPHPLSVENTCAAEYKGCLGAPTEVWDGDEYCAHCAQCARENHIEDLESELASELQRVRDAHRDIEEAHEEAECLRKKLAAAKGEVYVPAFRADPEMAVYILRRVMEELESGLAGAPSAAADAAAKYGIPARGIEDTIRVERYAVFVRGVKHALTHLTK